MRRWSAKYTLMGLWICLLLSGVTNRLMAAGIGLTLEALPWAPAVADGVRLVHIPVRILDEGGDVVLGAKVEATCPEGQITHVWEAAPGLHIISWRPPAAEVSRSVSLTLTARRANQQGVSSVVVPLSPPGRGGVEMRFEPDPFMLGRHKTSALTILTRDGRGLPVDEAALTLRTSAGRIEGLAGQGSGRMSGAWTPPVVRSPQLALFSAVDARNPEQYGFAVVPMVGAATFPVSAPPGVRLSFQVGERSFGPFVTDAKGIAQVTLEVPPGVDTATVISTDVSGRSRQELLDLSAPPTQRILMAVPDIMAGSGQNPITLRALAVDVVGKPRRGLDVEFMADDGEFGPVVEEAPGMYTTRWTPPDVNETRLVQVVAQIKGEEKVQVDRMTIRLVPPAQLAGVLPTTTRRPDAHVDWLALTATPGKVVPGTATDVKVVVQGFNSFGVAVPLDRPVVLASSRGNFETQQLRPEGELVARLRLPALEDGTRVVVMVADPEEGKATWNQVQVGSLTRPVASPEVKVSPEVGVPEGFTTTAPAPKVGDGALPPPAEEPNREAAPAEVPPPPVVEAAPVEVPPVAESPVSPETPLPEPAAPAVMEVPPVVETPPAAVETPPAAMDPAPVVETPPAMVEAAPALQTPPAVVEAAPAVVTPPASRPAEVVPPRPDRTQPEVSGPPAPPPSGTQAGTRIYPLYPVGLYSFSQRAESATPVVIPDDNFDFSSGTVLGFGVGADYWFSPEVGLSGRYVTESYGFSSDGELSEAGVYSDFRRVVSADLRVRRLLGRDAGLTFGGRVGLSRQDYAYFRAEATDEGGEEVIFTPDQSVTLGRVGIDVQLFPSERGELWLSGDVGRSLADAQSVHAEVGGSIRVSEAASIGAAAEVWGRTIPLQNDDGDVVGRNADTWVLGWVFLGLHH